MKTGQKIEKRRILFEFIKSLCLKYVFQFNLDNFASFHQATQSRACLKGHTLNISFIFSDFKNSGGFKNKFPYTMSTVRSSYRLNLQFFRNSY